MAESQPAAEKVSTENICLVIDFDDLQIQQIWRQKTGEQSYSLKIEFATEEDAIEKIKTLPVIALVLFSSSLKNEQVAILRAFQKFVGPLNEFQLFICDDPLPNFMANVFEFGIERFATRDNWPAEIAAFCRSVTETIEEPDSPELKITHAHRLMHQKRADMSKASEMIEECSQYSYGAAFTKGKILEYQGKAEDAAEAFRSSQSMNRVYRPSSEGLGQSLLTAGKVEEAITILENMEKSNPYFAERKLDLASAYVEKGDPEKAANLLKDVAEKDPENDRIKEVETHIKIKSGNLEGALKVMDGMHDVGPEFAARLNLMAIDLAKAGKGQEALDLYTKAHKIVIDELKYKITLNIALAYHRMEDFERALTYLEKVEEEYGSSYPKLDKIRTAIISARDKKTAGT